MKTILNGIVVTMMAVLLVACGGNDTPVDESAVAIAAALTQTAVSQVNEPAVDEASTPAPSAAESTLVPPDDAEPITPAEEMPTGTTISLNGVSFNYDEAITGGAPTVALIPRTPQTPGPGHGGGNPESVRFDFPNGGSVDVFAVEEYLGLFPLEYEIVDAVEAMVAERPLTTDSPYPFLPPPPAAQIFAVQLGYVDFQNGAGARYLTQYAQAFLPVEPTYTFQGVTADGQFYIAANLPVSSDVVPIISDEEFNRYMNEDIDGYIVYMDETIAALDGLTADQFSPSLTAIDNMMASFMITPTDFPSPGAPTSEIPDCINDAEFVADVTIPDNTEIAHETTFDKVWTVRNTGTCTWTNKYSIRFDDGDEELVPQTIIPPTVEVPPGSDVDITITFKAPYLAGSYTSWWKMQSPAQRPFGDRFYLLIDVPQTDDNKPVTEVPGYGVIRGALAYPSNAIPAQTILFQNVNDSGQVFSLQTGEGWDSYENELPAGDYYVFARVVGDTSGFGGGYTAAVPCGLSADCTDHSLLSVTIREGSVIENIDVTDWYAPEGTFPFP